jgi:hypothetical protein
MARNSHGSAIMPRISKPESAGRRPGRPAIAPTDCRIAARPTSVPVSPQCGRKGPGRVRITAAPRAGIRKYR